MQIPKSRPKIGGTLFWSPYNKDPTIYGTILWSPIFGNSHMGSSPSYIAVAT